jgi:GntR family transcriptional regulator
VHDTAVQVRSWIASSCGAGDRLPRETELAEQFEVSRATIRDALSQLEDIGVVIRRWGVGTFVAEPPGMSIGMNEIVPLRDQFRAAGHEPELGHVEVVREEGDPRVCETLRLPAGSPVWRVERLFCLEGNPAVLLCDRLPVQVNGRPLDATPLEDVTVDVVALLRQQVGVRVVRMEGHLQAEPATPEVAGLMKIPAGLPIVRMVQHTFGSTGEAVIHSDIYYRTDVATLTVVRTPRGARTTTTAVAHHPSDEKDPHD